MIFHRQSHDVIILPNNGQIYQLWNCLLILSQAPKFFSIFQSSITALWYGSLVKKNNKGHVNGRHKALFLSQFPWSFVSKHEHCFWLGVSPLYPRQLSVTAALSEPLVLSCLVLFSTEKWHPWRRVCVPHRRGELHGFWQDRHVERPEVRTDLFLNETLLITWFHEYHIGSYLPCYKTCTVKSRGEGLCSLVWGRTRLQNECLDFQSDFVLWV